MKEADYTLVFDDINQAPAFKFGERSRFRNQHGVANLSLAFFIVSIETFHLLDDLSEFRMGYARRCLYNGCFVHFGRDDLPDTLFAKSAGFGNRGNGSLLAHGLFGGCNGFGLFY